MKGSYVTLTPFDTSRRSGGSERSAAKSSDYNLTPFTSRMSSDSSSTVLEAAAAATTDNQATETAATKPRRSTLSDSSDSAEEPIDPRRRDPDVR